MLKLEQNPTFTRTVVARVPVDGGYCDEEFTATFKVVPLEKLKDFDTVSEEGTRVFLEAVIESLGDIADESGKQVPYSTELRDRVLGLAFCRTALAREYTKSITGAIEGN